MQDKDNDLPGASEPEHNASKGAAPEWSSNQDPYAGLVSLINSGIFIEPGIKFKEQFYPNLKALLKALENKEELIELQFIAIKGMEKNNEVQEEHPNRDLTQNAYRLILFESIFFAQSLEEAVQLIKSRLPFRA
ncbi:hypothetical protein ELY21_04180 [Legionella sp. km535]|uniref:hypothetical protein n=1 Tax=Legionella sp. km535 TaxID=2498107 RepID=UPI000F8C8E5B|nr:hypothetical protein [Legionella sp. km535]RUR19425.1 hypothetical protein ELY21_04180 [Legionella sp. km535]